MAAIEPLCEFCAKIPLDPSVLKDGDTWKLGSGLFIGSSTCPLCVLVKLAHNRYEGSKLGNRRTRVLSGIDNVDLVWRRDEDADQRGSFSSNLGFDDAICFASADEDDYKKGHPSRYLRPVIPPQLDIARVAGWISACWEAHSTYCYYGVSKDDFQQIYPGLKVMRFIDVEQNCIVEKTEFCKYAALSYVWGDTPSLRLSRLNLVELLLPGRIKDVEYMIPGTIKEAMELVLRLKIRYLWVDTLCLIQTDHDDMERGLAIMDRVYQHSWLTIIVADGYNSAAGLPGILEGSREASRQSFQITTKVSMGLTDRSPSTLMFNCVWATRAWTFQEHLTSNRTLTFFDGQVCFQCKRSNFMEAYFDHTLDKMDDPSTYKCSSTINGSMMGFASMIGIYCLKSLSYQSDILRALAGQLRVAAIRHRCSILQGMSTATLDWMLLFDAYNIPLRRRHGFPSYSWAGWQGSIRWPYMPDNINNWLAISTWIVWYERDIVTGTTKMTFDPSTSDSRVAATDPDWIGYREGRRHFPRPRDLPQSLATDHTLPTQDVDIVLPDIPYPLLQFWTLTVSLTISDVDVFTGYGYLIDSGGNRCGVIQLDILDDFLADTQGPHEIMLLSKMAGPVDFNRVKFDCNEKTCGFWQDDEPGEDLEHETSGEAEGRVTIGKDGENGDDARTAATDGGNSMERDDNVRDDTDTRQDDDNIVGDDRKFQTEDIAVARHTENVTHDRRGRMFFVFLLKWEAGVAQRRGIGRMSEYGITADADPVWKEILLA